MVRRLTPAMPVLLTLLALAVAGVTGCLKPAGPPRAGNEVVLYLRATPAQLELWQKAVTEFTAAQKIPVVIQNETYEHYWSKLQTMVAGGSPPDVVFMESTRFPEFVTKGTLLNLEPYLRQQKTTLDPSDFYPEAWRSYQYQGMCYGLPNDLAVLAMPFNKDLFQSRYVTLPRPGWTWTDYLKAAQELTLDTNEDGRTDTFGTTLCPWWQVYVWQNGGELVDDVANPRRSTLSAPAAQEALQFLADLSLKHKVAPSASLVQTTGRVDLFAAGKIAMIYAGHWDVPAISRQAGFLWETVPIPRGKQAANLGLGSGFCIMKGTQKAEAAWKLAVYLAADAGQQTLLGGGFSTPAYRPLALSNALGAQPIGPGDPYVQGIKVAHPVPFTTRYTAIAEVWDQELPLLWTGQATVAEVTRRIDQRVDKLLAESQPATAWLGALVPRG